MADYMLQAAGTGNLTPWTFQADIMNGTGPSPQDVARQKSLLTQHQVTVFLYNQQVTGSLTQAHITLAHDNGILVIGVHETMPSGSTYQSWMEAEAGALTKAVASKAPTEHLERPDPASARPWPGAGTARLRNSAFQANLPGEHGSAGTTHPYNRFSRIAPIPQRN